MEVGQGTWSLLAEGEGVLVSTRSPVLGPESPPGFTEHPRLLWAEKFMLSAEHLGR